VNVAHDAAGAECLTAEDLGLPADARIPLRFLPSPVWSPLVVSFPHVGLAWPHDLRPKPQVDFARNTDFQIHAVYAKAGLGTAASVQAIYSRLLIDLNRATDDVSAEVVRDHPAPRPGQDGRASRTSAPPSGRRGIIWDRTVRDLPVLEAPLSYETFQSRVRRYYEPYYRALDILLRRRRERFGYAILLDAHSMPSRLGIDLVLGTLDGCSCHPNLADAAMRALRSVADSAATAGGRALKLRLNDPYRGGEIVRRFGRPAEGIHALQLEVNRGLYMDERTTRLWPSRPSPGLAAPALELTDRPEASHGTRIQGPERDRLEALLAGVRCLLQVLAGERGDLGLAGDTREPAH
jgi:N-formylglutamate amidohydrolase